MLFGGHYFLGICLLALIRLKGAVYQNAGEDEDENSICNGALTCGDCLILDPNCAWCESDGYANTDNYRCDVVRSLQKRGCLNYTMPQSEVDIITNIDLRNAGTQGEDDAIQIKPQEVILRLRAGDSLTLNVSVRQAEDYPVDLYYVMDLSRSMEDDLEKLKTLGQKLASDMQSITSNFRLGFGVFVDKTVLPYISTVPRKINSPCKGCEAPYSFKNILPLDTNTDLFAQRVNETRISGNIDTPEGSLDALMQATVCKNEIGWRDKARHLIVYTSDASFHIAGDGRLGGIVRPNDGQCHLDVEGEYSTAHLYDYPSIGILNAKMRENNVIPIFAVVSRKHQLYQNLTELIEGSNVGILDTDSGNIVDIVKRNYERITQKVELVDTAPASLQLTYRSRCRSQGGDLQEVRVCNGLRLGEEISFEVDVIAQECLGNYKNTSFVIQPIGFKESLTVNVEVICSCDCENIPISNPNICSKGNGTLVCGECACNKGRYGKSCECSGIASDNSEAESDAGCRQNNSTIVCSGRGECVCGGCVCNTRPNPSEIISGSLCECDNFSCARHIGEICGGPGRGQCACDKINRQSACKCISGYKGDACECPTRTDTCLARNGLICNAVGTCTCGKCSCDPLSRFQGDRCDECATCNRDQCYFHKACVHCKIVLGGGSLSEEECDMCLLDIREVQYLPYLKDAKNCSFVDDGTNCSINFAYQTLQENDTIVVYYEKEQSCARSDVHVLLQGQNLMILIGGIVLSIVLIGIVLALIYRLWTYIQDRKEYAQWVTDQQDANWEKEQNPIYKSNISTFKNPMYNK